MNGLLRYRACSVFAVMRCSSVCSSTFHSASWERDCSSTVIGQPNLLSRRAADAAHQLVERRSADNSWWTTIKVITDLQYVFIVFNCIVGFVAVHWIFLTCLLLQHN